MSSLDGPGLPFSEIDARWESRHPDHPHITGWRKAMAEFTPRIGVCLHEDYDARGLYGYELNRDRGLHLAGDFLRTVSPILPWDNRRTIEGKPARQGVIRRRRIPLRENLPEAVVLYQAGTPCTLTFETPSEFSLAVRVRIQACLVDEVCRWDAARGLAE